MVDTSHRSPGRSVREPPYVESTGDEFELTHEEHNFPHPTVIDGWLKFRDVKKWKPRWCVMRKLSPVADCLHLQLYRNSKERYKQGQTKASLSLQHFLGVHSGFTLDKESNTIAIICQDVTVVLAFDTRERLIQWQVKIANNLGEGEQFLVQIQSAPSRGKIPAGPARLHVQERQFSMTVGVPPRLVGLWQIAQLRRYGVVESRFCFEGGSRCGRGEGLYVLVSDQSEEIGRVFQLAAEGKLHSRKRHLSRSALDSPMLRQRGAADESVAAAAVADESSWPSSESQPDCDTASVNEYPDVSFYQEGVVTGSMERCMSCISKLGALSRSSTMAMAQTPGAAGPGFTPAWTMETESSNSDPNKLVSASDLNDDSNDSTLMNVNSIAQPTAMTENRSCIDRCQCCPPSRPPKPGTSNTLQRKFAKPPMPLPPTCSCHHTCPYGNYDVPKAPYIRHQIVQNYEPCSSPTDGLYDKPKDLRESLLENYGNYDTPPHSTIYPSSYSYSSNPSRTMELEEKRRSMACPCHRVMSWMSLPFYCRRGYGRENTAPGLPIHKVKLSGEGKMPLMSTNKTVMPIYATVDRSKKTRCRLNAQGTKQNCEHNGSTPNLLSDDKPIEELNVRELIDCSNYSNIESSLSHKEPHTDNQTRSEPVTSQLYMNFQFAQSLEYYENSKDLLIKNESIKKGSPKDSYSKSELETEVVVQYDNKNKYCTKCGHTCSQTLLQSDGNHDDYLIMKPTPKGASEKSKVNDFSVKCFSGYLPMQPVSSVSLAKRCIDDNIKTTKGYLSQRAASSPSLTGPFVDRSNKPDLLAHSFHSVVHSVSASNSPSLIHRLANSADISGENVLRSNNLLRKRSNSADSARYLDDLESITERTASSSPTQLNHLDTSKNTSMDSLCSQSQSVKRLNNIPLSNSSSYSNIPTCNVDTLARKEITVPYETDTTKVLSATMNHIGNSSNHISVKNSLDRNSPSIRRSFSVPCKVVFNRDSSSSNDSGVSIGSLKQRRSDFAEFELPLTTSMSTIRHHHVLNQGLNSHLGDCFHASLPRRSKSSDPLRELSFKFRESKIAPKSSSAEAEVPICLTKKDANKGYLSPSGVPYIDSHSTSSGTSDMSDYIETLSLSSYSSSDTPESLKFSRTAATTLRPRSGKEYHKIDRYYLDGDIKNPPYTKMPHTAEN